MFPCAVFQLSIAGESEQVRQSVRIAVTIQKDMSNHRCFVLPQSAGGAQRVGVKRRCICVCEWELVFHLVLAACLNSRLKVGQ